MNTSRAALVLLALLALLAACAAQQKVEKKSVEDYTFADYFPIAKGNAWAYNVETADAEGKREAVLVSSRVIAFDGETATIQSGSQELKYQVRPDGIFKPVSGYYLLKSPIKEQARWEIPGSEGGVTITATGVLVQTEAGQFSDCIVVVEELVGQQRAEWTYAPQVGPVKMRIFEIETGTPKVILEGELKAYQIAGGEEGEGEGDDE